MRLATLLPLLLAALGPGTRAAMSETDATTMETDVTTTETTTETTTSTTTDTTTTSVTTTTTTTSVTTTADTTTSNATEVNGTQTPIPIRMTTVLLTKRSYPFLTPSPDSPTSNTTTVQSANGSASATAHGTALPVSVRPATPHSNTTANSSGVGPPPSTDTMGTGSTVVPGLTTITAGSGKVPPPVGTSDGSAVPTSSSNATADNGTDASPTGKVSVTAQGSAAPGKGTTSVLAGSDVPNPSKAAGLPTLGIQLLLRVPLSFRILNRNFSESLLNPTSKEYVSLSQSVLAMFKSVFGCAKCASRQAYQGCSELRFSHGSVVVQSDLVFERGNGSVTVNAAEKQLKNSLDPNGFIMGLQLDNIRSAADENSPAPASAVPAWAIALLVLVCILVLLSILIFLLLTTCSCRRKSHGKLDLFSTKDSYHPMAEYPTYQSHGRYASPTSKHNPYSQVAGSNGAGAGTFSYTNPAPGSDNL